MSVGTVRVIDKRIEPQPEPVYAETVGPLQNQFYKIPQSGLSDTYITFNNLTTLGQDRAYLDTFELEITADITFHVRSDSTSAITDNSIITQFDEINPAVYILPDRPQRKLWTFDSFPFNKCCDQVKVNINGGAFFSQPLSYLRAKERYWNEDDISKCYSGICPCHKPYTAYESGIAELQEVNLDWGSGNYATEHRDYRSGMALNILNIARKQPTRILNDSKYTTTASGVNSTTNNAIIPNDAVTTVTPISGQDTVTFTVTWREPVFASPFSSRLDETYGRPLYNITSMDLAFNMMDLGNMIRCCDPNVKSYDIHLTQVQLCYQVETVPLNLAPPSTVVPYRRYVPYITDGQQPLSPPPSSISNTIERVRVESRTITSGVYTLNEIPTAIWLFMGPTKRVLQENNKSSHEYQYREADYDQDDPTAERAGKTTYPLFDNNKGFGNITHINLSLANTTQILNTAAPQDLYRISKANGLQDNWNDFRYPYCKRDFTIPIQAVNYSGGMSIPCIHSDGMGFNSNIVGGGGMGSVIRLIPGTDIVIPDQPLLPGSNANNIVFQAEVTAEFPIKPSEDRDIALWILFEYVGVATITPGQCEITMNPLGSRSTLPSSTPVMSASTTTTPSTTEGSGWLDVVKQLGGLLKNSGIVGNAVGLIPGVGTIAGPIAKMLGWGYKRKRPETSGGALMALGDFT